MEFINNMKNFFWVNCQYNLKDEPRAAQPLPNEIFQFFVTHVISARGVVDLIRKRYGRNLFFLIARNPHEQDENKFFNFFQIPLDFDSCNSPKTLLDICSQRPDRMIRRLYIHSYNRVSSIIDIEFMRPIFYQRMTDPITPTDAIAATRCMSITIENGVPKSAELFWDPIFFTDEYDSDEVCITARYAPRGDNHWEFNMDFAGKLDELPSEYHRRISNHSPRPTVPPYSTYCMSVTEFIDRRVQTLFKKMNVYSFIRKINSDICCLGVIEKFKDDLPNYARPLDSFRLNVVNDKENGDEDFLKLYQSCHEDKNENFVTNVQESYDFIREEMTMKIEWCRPVFFTIRKSRDDENTYIANLHRSMWVTYSLDAVEKVKLRHVMLIRDANIAIPSVYNVFPGGDRSQVDTTFLTREIVTRYNVRDDVWTYTIPYISPYKK